jgi:hypothetical protein
MEVALRRGTRAPALAQPDSSYDSFLAALELLARSNDIAPLLGFLRSDRPLTADMRRDIAGLIEMLHARTLPRARGKPTGKAPLYRNPNYWAAHIVRVAIARWKTETGKRRIPNDVKEDLVKQAIEGVSTWKVAQEYGQPPRFERVLEILRKPRHRSF